MAKNVTPSKQLQDSSFKKGVLPSHSHQVLLIRVPFQILYVAYMMFFLSQPKKGFDFLYV